jgi:uncharacterized protein (TIGR03067 family)
MRVLFVGSVIYCGRITQLREGAMSGAIEKLGGTWQATRVEAGGQVTPAGLVRTLTYRFDWPRVTLLEAGKSTGVGNIRVYSDATPARIDVEMLEGPAAGHSVAGIYRLEGDRLTLYLGAERPAEFSGAGASSLIELERAEKE